MGNTKQRDPRSPTIEESGPDQRNDRARHVVSIGTYSEVAPDAPVCSIVEGRTRLVRRTLVECDQESKFRSASTNHSDSLLGRQNDSPTRLPQGSLGEAVLR